MHFTHVRFVRPHSRLSSSARLLLILGLLLSALGLQAPGPTSTALAQPLANAQLGPEATTNILDLNVISARTEPRAFGGVGVAKGAAVTAYKYIINIDNTGTTTQRANATDQGGACSPSNPGYPGTCQWTSIAGVPGSSPIYAEGNQDDFNGTNPAINLPNGRYLISVMASGYKLDGAHFTVPLSGPVTVELQPNPLPTATIRARIFEDTSPVNSGPDEPAEHGLPGFVGHIADYLGEVTTDVFGNPLCTQYEMDVNGNVILNPPDYTPTPIPGTGGHCISDANGDLVIPNVGPNRYALSATPPDGQTWIQTTTLEGNHDWDAWVMEGATGLDTEFIVAGEPYPAIFFGFVKPTALPASPATGEIKGLVMATKVYVPTTGGLGLPGTIWGGLRGAKLDKPIDRPWIALTDLTNGDTAVYVGQGNPDGTFDIPHVPDGNYTLTWWDEPQDYILDLINVTVSNGELVDLGVLPLTGWWTQIEGHVFNDLNENGKMDPGEPGLANFPVTMKKRENSVMDRGATTVTTDANGYYYMENAYPITQWLVQEVYSDLYHTTGVTYQADNQPTETTVLGAGVDVSVLPIIGLSGRLDWGVKQYAAGTNGGIVGTVSYDTTRNELDPRYAFVEIWQPGIPNLTVNLHAPVICGTHAGTSCDSTGRYELAPDGSFAKGKLLNVYVTENWQRPKGCVARNVDGDPLTYPADQQVLPTDPNADCLEGPLMSNQFGAYPTDQGTPDANFGATVDGNYGFGDACYSGTLDAADPANPVCNGGAFSPLTPGDYLVDVQIPNDALGRPMYQVTKEEDINIFSGDQWVPQIPPAACVGPLHTVDVAGVGTDGYPATTLPGGITVPASAPVDNPDFAGAGGSPYEGLQKPLCTTKLVTVSNGRSTAPGFNLFTDVPIPGRFWGLIVDDLNFSSNPRSLTYGEKAGVPFAPVGIYDYANRLVDTVESDYNGLFDVLLPSTTRINCPTPSGVCANLYRFVGNDPGIPGRLNLNYNPQFRTIAAEFEAFPGLLVPADLAPTQVGVTIQLPGSQFNQPISCALDAATPQIFAVSRPYVNGSGSFTITGQGFGATQGAGQVTLDATALPVTSWNDRSIAVTVPGSTPVGPHQLKITAANGQRTINGLTFHVLGSGGAMPSLPVLDNFNRTNANTLGANWSQTVTAGIAAIRVNNNQAQALATGQAIWNGTGNVFGAAQGAAFTFANAPVNIAPRPSLILKASGGTAASPNNYIVVTYQSPSVVVATTTNAGGTLTTRGTFAATFASGDTLTAAAYGDGSVYVFKTTGATTTLLGSVAIPTIGTGAWTQGTGGGRIGMQLPIGQRVDNFSGGTVTTAPPGAAYQPNVYEVGPGKPYSPTDPDPSLARHAIQRALNAAAASAGNDLVVVYPGIPDPDPRVNPRGAYYENLIMTTPVKLQGVGPGGVYPDGTRVPGSIVDGGAFGGDSVVATDWYTTILGLTWDGNQNIFDGAVVSIFTHDGAFTAGYPGSIDGFDLRGGDQQGFPGNLNVIGGGITGLPANLVTQGGAIFANGYARNLQITNNVVENNGGAYGTIRLGTPDLPAPNTSSHNENVRIANNRVIANAGTNLAGGIGLFAGADAYEVAYNDICGNFSAEYGGGLTVYGLSPNGKIHHNRIYFDRSYDEGGGVMIAGELPASTTALSPGTGPADIFDNLIQANLGNDDGGGLRFLMAGNFPFNVYNNMIVNNVSTHEGGGISLNDAPNVRVYNNTIMKNITTATALTSNGLPAPAGLSTSANSTLLQATLPSGAPRWSNPLVFNNIFWDNRAGTRAGATVIGLGIAGDVTPINHWDLADADGIGLLSPTNSILQVTAGTNASPTNKVGTDPNVALPYNSSVGFSPWRTNPNFVSAIMVGVDLAPNLLSNYRIQSGSPAVDAGAAAAGGVNAPSDDIDGILRPQGAGFDMSANEVWTLPPQAPVVTISRSGSNAVLNWAAVTLDTGGGATVVTSYQVFRSTSPYFAPDVNTLWATVLTPGFTDTGVVGNVGLVNYYYVVRAMNAGGPSVNSNRVGVFNFGLTPGVGAVEYLNQIALPLEVLAQLPNAQALAAYIGAGVTQVLHWDPASQTFEFWLPAISFGTNFNLQTGQAYWVQLDNTGPSVVSFLGGVPTAGALHFSLIGASPNCLLNNIMLPLDQATITTAGALSASVTQVDQALHWDALSQTYEFWLPAISFGTNFTTEIGHPYQLCLAAGAPAQWP